MNYKGVFRAVLEQEQEEEKTVKGIDGEERKVDEVYYDPAQNTEANALGIFESGVG